MEETILNTKNQRRPWIAVLLSLIIPGLGHMYCGKAIRAVVFVFICNLPIPLIYIMLATPKVPFSISIAAAAWILSSLAGLIAIIDSGYVAKHTRADYELKDYNRWYVYVLLIIVSMVGGMGGAFQLKERFVEAFRVPVNSMYPTIEANNRILANKIVYRNQELKRGEIVVFNPPNENWKWNYIKRVVAVAGDTVEIRKGELFINGQIIRREKMDQITVDTRDGKLQGQIFIEDDSFNNYKIFMAEMKDGQEIKVKDFAETTVPKGHCFVLGDNRNSSNDSRNFGPVPLSSVKGRAEYLYFPLSRFGSLRPNQ